MPNYARKRCVICGKHASEVGPISWNGYCAEHGMALLEENIVGIATRSGPAHRRRLRGLERYLERERLDDRAPAA